jgi:hypothetical protein
MRKLILIATIAMMSTTSCYANLSLASNEPTADSVEHAKAQAPVAATPAIAAKTSTAAKPHRRRPLGVVASPTYPVRNFSYGYAHCL